MVCSCNKRNHDDEVEEKVDELAGFRDQDYEEQIAAFEEAVGAEGLSQEEKDKELAKVLVPLLAMQCYHLPGYSWFGDWMQYVANNHPILGICAHHRLHPLGATTRIIALIGTLVFGLALTCVYELLFLQYPHYQHEIWSFERNGEVWVLTTGMLSLWTVGGAIHTVYNLFMWHIAACSCMREGGCMERCNVCGCQNCGKKFSTIFVFFIALFTAFVVLLKVIIANHDGPVNVTDLANFENYKNIEYFGFIVGYLVGMTLSFFIYYPFGVTILFSGILGCGKLPVLGGRPREVAIERNMLAKQEKKKKRKKKKKPKVEHDVEARLY